MALTKEDIKTIQKIVDSGTEIINARFDSFEEYVEKRFAEVDRRLDNIEKKIEQLIRTENLVTGY